MTYVPASFEKLKKLNLRDRNRVRSILYIRDEDKALDLLNRARKRLAWQEILQIERALRAVSSPSILPALFPEKPQTDESFARLRSIDMESSLQIINAQVAEHKDLLRAFCEALKSLNFAIVRSAFAIAGELIGVMRRDFGDSHLLLRKAALIKAIADDSAPIEVEELLDAAGLGRGNIISTSLLHCYQEEPDYLTLKRSVLNLASKGSSNKFTRDLSRIPFHPHAKDDADLDALLQSLSQSSLVDVCMGLKINLSKVTTKVLSSDSELLAFLRGLEAAAPSLDDIAAMATGDEAEDLFLKRSSAWFEAAAVVECRFAIDHFNDTPDAPYLTISEATRARAGMWLRSLDPEQLVEGQRLTHHNCAALAAIEESGAYTRSAAFNYGLWRTDGFVNVSEKGLYDLMGCTRDLARTSNPAHLRNLASVNASEGVKLISYLLVAKRSKSERDDHKLRNIIQNIAIMHHGGNLLDVIVSVSKHSTAVAEYAYEICTEDFIAKLSRITTSAAQITETRAALHMWMGESTKRKIYFDRARTMRIDHQINKIRNEIDDNRIYVDAARFSEWVNDELVAELNALFGSLQKNAQWRTLDATHLIGLIARCYSAFCQNQVFGVASYLGRRIRHGTFKGHLFYSTVGAIENSPDYHAVAEEVGFQAKWQQWRKEFEGSIDEIIRDRLHVESPTKKNGFLRTSIDTPEKYEIALGCAKNIAQEYVLTNSAATAATVLIDYCWRLAEVDLKSFNSWLKGQKNSLLRTSMLDGMKATVPYYLTAAVLRLNRETIRSVTEKLNGMSAWFKRPPSVSPKASLNLLFRAVVAEVQETFPGFLPMVDDTADDIELFGGAYHILYDSFYVAVFNAAKHGKVGGRVDRRFRVEVDPAGGQTVVCEITSELREDQTEQEVSARLHVAPGDESEISNAQLFEGRSGIRKLYQLGSSDDKFKIRSISCSQGQVCLAFAYSLL